MRIDAQADRSAAQRLTARGERRPIVPDSNRPILAPTFEELRGLRVLMRPYRMEDAETLFAVVNASREHLNRWLHFAHRLQTLEDTRNYIAQGSAKWLLHESFSLGIWLAANGDLLGDTRLLPTDWNIPAFEIGYWLAANAEGHGYMAEAGGLIVEAASTVFGARRVAIRCDARNERSAAVARRLGFTEEGLLRNTLDASDGVLRDTLVLAKTF